MRLGLLTSGGDAPGMNAAIRAIVRTGTDLGAEMLGIRRGYAGLIEGALEPLDNRGVGGIIERGGTILHTARAAAFRRTEGQARALGVIRDHGIEGLIVIGGNGSLAGARWLDENGVPTVGIPASIDNDIPRTETAIGVDTAVNTVVEALDRIRDTAIAHDRAFVVEVMGRSSGYIALVGGIAGGAEVILLPEKPVALSDVVAQVVAGLQKGKHHSIIVVAEGFTPPSMEAEVASAGRAVAMALERSGSIETRLTILGHLQRGGSPTAADRILACRLGARAVFELVAGRHGTYLVLNGRSIGAAPFAALDEACENVDIDLLHMADTLAH